MAKLTNGNGSPSQETAEEAEKEDPKKAEDLQTSNSPQSATTGGVITGSSLPTLDTSVKPPSIDSLNLPIVSNTSSVANLPCATSFGAGGGVSMAPSAPSVSSLISGSPLVFPHAGASLANAVYSANLAANLTSVGGSQNTLASVFSRNPILPSASVWPPPTDGRSLLNGVDQAGGILSSANGALFAQSSNPLLDLHSVVGADKLLSEEEFYRAKRKLMAESSHSR